MAIVKIKIDKVYIEEKEKEIVGKVSGKKFLICPIAVKVADDNEKYPGVWIKSTAFPYEDKKDSSKNKTATQMAEKFREYNEGKTILLNVTESEYEKDGEKKTAYTFKTLSKKEKEVASQFIN